MRHSACGRAVGVFAPLAVAATVEATPFLPADISAGANITGSLSFPVSSSPPDQAPSPVFGQYLISESTALMRVSVGDSDFETNLTGLFVGVSDAPVGAEADFIQLRAPGDEKTFAPFLTGFARQDASLDPRGEMIVNFRFPATYLSSDAFPTSIDPLATAPGTRTSGIFGQVEGVSTQTPTSGIREWAFFFDIDPLSLNFVLDSGLLSSDFSGTISGVDDRAVIGPPMEPIPEPSTMVLVLSGLWAVQRMARRSSPSGLART